MTRASVLALGVSIVLAAASSSAQGKTDFSGRWTTDPVPGAAPAGGRQGGPPAPVGGGRGDMGSGWGPTITISQTATSLTVEYAFFARGDMQPPLKFTYALDGSPSKNSVMMGRGMQTQMSTTAWDGASLIITTVHTFPDPGTNKQVNAEVKQTLSLESPTSLVVETVRAGVLGGPATTTRTTYRKI
jgi:hypothetical protein